MTDEAERPRAPRIIGLCGVAGSGKSTIARALVEAFGLVPCAFATPFKLKAVVGGWPVREVLGPDPKSDETRAHLQVEGTEMGRKRRGEDVWIRYAEADLYRLARYGVRGVVYDDVRFPNEADWIQSLGGVTIRLERDGAGLEGTAADHPSEREAGAVQTEWIVDNNRSVDETLRVIARLVFPDDRFLKGRD